MATLTLHSILSGISSQRHEDQVGLLYSDCTLDKRNRYSRRSFPPAERGVMCSNSKIATDRLPDDVRMSHSATLQLPANFPSRAAFAAPRPAGGRCALGPTVYIHLAGRIGPGAVVNSMTPVVRSVPRKVPEVDVTSSSWRIGKLCFVANLGGSAGNEWTP
jgi:hypothetical protein